MMSRRTVAGLTILALAPMGSLAVSGAASAHACYQKRTHTNLADGSFTMDNVAILVGPDDSCGTVARGDSDDDVSYYCYVNGDDATWSYIYDRTQGKRGWVRDSMLADNGSSTMCV